MTADAFEPRVGAQDHGQRVPPDHAADAMFHGLVPGEGGLLLGRDRVDVARLGQGRNADLELAGPLEEAEQDEARPFGPRLLDHRVERVEPFLGLGGVDIRELVFELVEDVVHDVRILPADRLGHLMSRAERRQYQRMTKGQDPERPADATGRCQAAAPTRSSAPRARSFTRRFWVRSGLASAAVGIIGLSVAWSSGADRALVIGAALTAGVLGILVAARWYLKRSALRSATGAAAR